MNQCEFWEKVWLTVIDKGLLALIVLVAGFYLNRFLEAFKGKLSREQEFVRTVNIAVVDLTKKLAAGNLLISWLSWSATNANGTLLESDFIDYDKKMLEVLSDLVGLQASVAALDPSKYKVLSSLAEQLHWQDVEVGKARDLFLTEAPDKVQQSVALLQNIYHKSQEFDEQLLTAVTGLLVPSPVK